MHNSAAAPSQTPAMTPCTPRRIAAGIECFREHLRVVRDNRSGRLGVVSLREGGAAAEFDVSVVAELPPIYPEWLGDRSFLETHGVRFPYVTGAMANGIATPALVVAMARAQMLGFYGAAGLGIERIREALREIKNQLGNADCAWGANLIHTPNEPELEMATAALFLAEGVHRISASAFMELSPSVVWYSSKGLHALPAGGVVRANHVFAKVSRPEVAECFMRPAAPELLDLLVRQGRLTAREAELAHHIPVAEDITVEADSGGHTDNRPLAPLLADMLALRERVGRAHRYRRRIRLGAAGGLGTPAALAGAFSMGAAYCLTGSINQSSVEAGVSADAKQMLAQAGIADVAMAPAADMFEQGIKLQVLKRGTLFAGRAAQLFQCYRSYPSLEAIPRDQRARLEAQIFRMPLDAVWQETCTFWKQRDPSQLTRAARDEKHRMALVFRWYLGNASRWAIAGRRERAADYQLWCSPAMGAFNTWVRGSFLEPTANRRVTQIALNLLEGAAVVTRAQQLRCFGVDVPPGAFRFKPRPLSAQRAAAGGRPSGTSRAPARAAAQGPA